ncbi:MAG: DNA primase [Planctomycetota bacterium]|nr:DNA primase [Planctomycetota bacterium]
MPSDPEFTRAIEEVKLRADLVEVVRERIPELRKRGRLWEACCPFHEERTPSFKVDPTRETWRCYGACQDGGDVISFVQKGNHLEFADALELLAARHGVELPRRGRRDRDGDDPGLVALASADRFFQSQLRTGEGRAALDYLRARGLSDNTLEAFGIGYAPRGGQALVQFAKEEGPARSAWEKAGLVRISEKDGEAYSFFRGRLIIPIRDVKGRTVGFGARRLDDGERSGPKYINTPETPWFHKGRLIYALDRAIDEVRRGGHLVLCEGYTDVMAAHQVGIAIVGAVLGTSTTADHAALVRRAGARRVSLVFDGDEAGRQAGWRALEGLLPLDIDIDVVRLPKGQDPADVLLESGPQPFLALLEQAQDWFAFVADGLSALSGRELAAETDRALQLLDRVGKPVLRDDLMRRLSAHLGMPIETLRQAWRQLPEHRREAARSEHAQAPRPRQQAPDQPVDRAVAEAYKAAAAAVLTDAGLVPRIRPWVSSCPNPHLRVVLEAILELFDDEDADLDVNAVMNHLEDHPVRNHVPSLEEHARAADCSPLQLLDQSLSFLASHAQKAEKRRLSERVGELQRASEAGDPAAAPELEATLERLTQMHRADPDVIGAAPNGEPSQHQPLHP